MFPEIDSLNLVVAALLVAAAMQAAWNLSVRASSSPFLTICEINATVGLLAVPVLLAAGLPSASALPWIAAAIGVRQAYYATVVLAYRNAEFGVIYPIMRGLNPLFITALGVAFLGDAISLGLLCGIALVVVGIVASATSRSTGRACPHLASLGLGLVTSAQVSVFTLLDGVGVRSIEGTSALSYASTMAVCDGMISLLVATAYRFRMRAPPLGAQIRYNLMGGALAGLSFWIGIWAISIAPLGLVSAIRESSILFAVGLSTWLLKEPLTAGRAVGSILILLGIVVIKFVT
jgi:drug/metabolite transporter (DMT)-like permease